MTKNEDLVEKIIALQGKVNNTIVPQYEQAQKAVADLEKQLASLDAISKAVGKLNAAQSSQLFNISQTLLPPAKAAEEAQRPAYQQQQKVQQTLGAFMDNLAANTKNMGPNTQQTYDSLKTAAFASPPDPAAQETFKRYIGSLQTVHTENMQKSLRTWVQSQVKAGLKVTIDDFAAQQSRLTEGETLMPSENPQIQKQFAAANARGLSRVFNRTNFRDHMTSGGYTALGYAALDLAQGAVQVGDTYLDGRRYTQEARARAAYGLLPGLGGIAGGVLGSFTPMGPIGGSLIGGSLGTAADGILSAQSEKHEDLRLSSETIALQLGRSTAAATRFADMIDKTADRMSVPAAELAKSSVAIASAVTGFGAGGVNLQARLSRGLGDTYTDYIPTQQQSAALPFSRSYREMLAGSVTPDANLFGDAAFFYAFTGDQDNMKKQVALRNVLSPSKDYQQYVADQQTAKPMGWWEATKQTGMSVLEGAPTATIIDHRAAQRRVTGYEATHAQKIAATQKALQNDTDFYTNVYEDSRAGRETALYGQTLAAIPSRQMQQAEARGEGLAGLRRYSGAELTDLSTAYGGVQSQEQILAKRLADKTLTPERRKLLEYLQASTQGQALDIQGQALDVRTGLFRQGLSEEQARFGGGYSRLGIGADALLLGGASSFDPRVGQNLAQRRSFLTGQLAYDLGLASDMTNYLTPEERQQRRTSAAQEGFEARYALPNQYAVQRIGDTQAGSGLRQADARIGIARGQATGDITATLTAQNQLVGEQLRLQTELKQRLEEGNLTFQQRTQLQTQIKDLTAQTVETQRGAFDAAVSGFQGRAEAMSSTSYSQQARAMRLRGTSSETLAMAGTGYEASLQAVAAAKYRMLDPTLSPDRRIVLQAQYEQAKNSAEQQGIDAFSTVQMGPVFERRQIEAEARLSRQMRSAFEPGSVIQSQATIAKMDEEKLARIDLVYKADMANQMLTREQKEVIARNLSSQREDTRNDLFDRQQSVDVGWVDRLVSMSVNAPSFAARLMPGSDRVASLAERRGLGRMSARVFGYTNQQSYRDSEGLGVLPSEMNRMAFGIRPGDFPSALGPDAPIVGGKGTTLDSIDAGGVGAGLPPQMVGELSSTLGALVALLGKGISVHVTQIDKSTGQQAAHTQNAGSVYNAQDIMKGGSSQRNSNTILPRY